VWRKRYQPCPKNRSLYIFCEWDSFVSLDSLKWHKIVLKICPTKQKLSQVTDILLRCSGAFYFEIHLHKKCTKLTPEDLKAIVLMSLVTLKKNSIQSWAQIYCWVKTELLGAPDPSPNFFLSRSSRRLSVFASFQKESSYGHDLHWKL
jgi:hypothetical protein